MATKLQIRIPAWASIEDVAQWNCEANDEVEFQVKRESGFKLFTTGAAISALQRIRSKASSITIHTKFAFPANIRTVSVNEWPSFFRTLVGVALLYAANRVIDVTGTDLSSVAFDVAWRQLILKTGGVIGDGQSQNLVCREFDSPIPEAVRASETNKIPSRKQFESVVAKLGGELVAGKSFFSSIAEAEVSGFLFETFRNAIEHAQPNQEGIWGISIEKLALQTRDEVVRREQIPDILREFVERRFEKRGGLWICVTVADYGLGIQNTLPPLHDEAEWPQLLRAFERGTSRKPKSGSPNRGQGLPNVIDEARRLRACIFVNSTGLAALFDTTVVHSEWSQIAIPSGLRGTSISVFWPVTSLSPDQLTLGL
jgi:anti-sigma regulatory factor (Ser/Thr protein kinase)